ncbi:MAG: hypothetical protein ABFC54_06220 [Thermoguttaceae bacterium]
MMHDEAARKQSLDEQLVAYLDGELSLEESRQIEAMLAGDAEARRRLQEMERTWELLDDLDALPAGNQFARSTLEMVAVSARQDIERSQAEAPRRRRRRMLNLGVAMTAAALLGFFLVWWLQPNPNRALLRDLPILENLDPYRQVKSLDFLQKLRDAKLFSQNATTADRGVSRSEPRESMAGRQHRVEQMTPAQKEQLLRQQNRFESLEPDERLQLRRLDESLSVAPDAAALRRVMRRYYNWLKTLTPYARSELAEMPSDRRLAAVEKRLRDERSRSMGERRLEAKDADAFWTWLEDCADRHAAELSALLPAPRQKELATWTPSARRRALLFELTRRGVASGSDIAPILTDDDLSRLRTKLAPETQKRLAAMSVARQWQTVNGWLRHQSRQRFARGATLSAADNQRLAQFFEEGLTDQQRDRLLAMPNDEMRRELQRMYFLGVNADRRPGSGARGKRSTEIQKSSEANKK